MNLIKFLFYFLGFCVAAALVAGTGGTILIPVAIILVVKWLLGGSAQKAPSDAGKASADPGKNASGSPSGPKICGHCGAENEANAAYCERCGHKLS